MKQNKLQSIRRYIENELLNELPVTYHHIDYISSQDRDSYTPVRFNMIQVTALGTTRYISTPHYKPISKCLAGNNAT